MATEIESRTANTGLAKVAVQCSADTFVGNQTLVLRINICGENRHPSLSPKPLALTLPKKRHDRQQANRKMKDKMPMLRKINRAASRHTSQRFCSTFNFTQPHLIQRS